jgi:hypothetical protein
MTQDFRIIRAVLVPGQAGNEIDATGLEGSREYVPGKLETELTIVTDESPMPDVITFNGTRFVPDTEHLAGGE